MILPFAFLFYPVVCALVYVVKIKMTLNARAKAYLVNWKEVARSPSFTEMVNSPFKWTYAQHFPGLVDEP